MNKLLIIDDDPSICDLLYSVAKKAGYESCCVSSFNDFRLKFDADVSVVILDLVMPDMDGIEYLRHLGERGCRAGILLISGMDWKILRSSENLARDLGLNVLGRLQKPISTEELTTLLKVWKQEPSLFKTQPIAQLRTIEITPQEIRHAIEVNQFVVHYLPRMDIRKHRVLGVEALARWNHPVHGLLSPRYFIEKTEALGLIDQLTWQVLNKSLPEMELLSEQGWPLSISFNLSAQLLSDVHMPEVLASCVRESNLEPHSIIVEIAEAGMLADPTKALDVMIRLRIKGFNVAIDEFGGGKSVLQQLRRIPANEIKIHRSFIAEMLTDEFSVSMMRKMIEFGHELGMHVLATGVESKPQLDKLREMSCERAQGYLFLRPVSIAGLSAWLQGQSVTVST